MIALLRHSASMLIGSIIAVVLQAMVAPYITIGYAMVSPILCFVVLMAIFRAEKQGYVMPFVLGMIYDLLGSGVVGAMALVCVVLTFIISRVQLMLASDTALIPIALIAFGCIFGELAYGCLLIVCGLDVSLLQAVIYRVLPCGIYDTVVSLVAYFLMARFLFSSGRADTMQVIR